LGTDHQSGAGKVSCNNTAS